MEIKIISDQVGRMGGDGCSYDKCHFRKNPTLQELADYCLSLTDDWGYISLNKVRVFEFRHGKVVNTTATFNLHKDTRIALKGIGGGWHLVDFDCVFLDKWKHFQHI